MIRTGQIHLDTSVAETTMPNHFCCGQLRHSHILNSALQKHFRFFPPFCLFVVGLLFTLLPSHWLFAFIVIQALAFCFHCYPGIGFLFTLLSRHLLSDIQQNLLSSQLSTLLSLLLSMLVPCTIPARGMVTLKENQTKLSWLKTENVQISSSVGFICLLLLFLFFSINISTKEVLFHFEFELLSSPNVLVAPALLMTSQFPFNDCSHFNTPTLSQETRVSVYPLH